LETTPLPVLPVAPTMRMVCAIGKDGGQKGVMTVVSMMCSFDRLLGYSKH